MKTKRPALQRAVSIALGAMCASCASMRDDTGVKNDFLSKPILRIETGMHIGPILRISSDKDRNYIVSASMDKTVRIWDASDGKLRGTFYLPAGDGLAGVPYDAAISPDGRTVAIATSADPDADKFPPDGELSFLLIIDRETFSIKHRISGTNDAAINTLRYSRDGKKLYAGVGNYGVVAFDTETADIVSHAEDCVGGLVTSIDTSTTGLVAATCNIQDNSHTVRVYSEDLRMLEQMFIKDGLPFSVTFSPDGDDIALGYGDLPRIDIIDVNTMVVRTRIDVSDFEQGSCRQGTWSGASFFGVCNKLRGGGGAILAWPDTVTGEYRTYPVARTDITAINAMRNGHVVFVTNDPSIGAIDDAGKATWTHAPSTADFVGQTREKSMQVSETGDVIRFGYERNGDRQYRFSLSKFQLSPSPIPDPALKTAKLERDDAVERVSKSNLFAFAPKCCILVRNYGRFGIRRFNLDGNVWITTTPGVVHGINITGDSRLALAALSDGTIRWYDINDGRELLAFFPHVDGKRWVAWMPEGFFAASEGGKDLIGYQLNRRADEAPEFVSADRLYDAFYRPDLVIARLEGDEAKVREALAKIGDVRAVLASLPPQVDLLGPPTDQAAAGLYRHRVRITDRGGGIGRFEIRVNNVIVEGERTGLQSRVGPSPEMQADLDLIDESSTIETTAYDAANKVASRTVIRKVNVEKAKFQQLPKLYGVIVGIDSYRDPDFALRYAAGDAAAIKRTLQTRARPLFANSRDLDEDLHLLADTQDTRDEPLATKAGIIAAFKAVAQAAEAPDVFLLYLAGHGLADDGTYYFLPQDLVYRNHEALVEGGLSKAEIEELVLSVKARKKLILIDTCQAGAFIDNQQLTLNVTDSRGGGEVEMKTALDRLMRATGGASIAASTSVQRAREGFGAAGNVHGVFTYAVLEALEGKADVPEPDTGRPDGYVFVNEMAAYVDKLVPIYSHQKWGREQFPMPDIKGQSFPVTAVP